MRRKIGLGILAAIVAISVVAGALLLPSTVSARVPEDAKDYGAKVTVEVYDELEEKWFRQTFDLDNSYVKVLFVQIGGEALIMEPMAIYDPIKWQIVLGMEDIGREGDYADAILKIIKLEKDNLIWFEVACLGTFEKKVYYEDALKMVVPKGAGVDGTNPRTSWVYWTDTY